MTNYTPKIEPATISASLYDSIQTIAAHIAEKYHVHDIGNMGDGTRKVTIAANDGDGMHELFVSDWNKPCDCRGFDIRGICSHSEGLSILTTSFTAEVNTRIADKEKRENFLIDKDIEGRCSAMELVELGALGKELCLLYRIGTDCDAVAQSLRLQAMAQTPVQAEMRAA